VWSDSSLIQVGRWLRRVHDATASFVPPADERWFIGGTAQPGLIVGHQDAAPYNAVMDGDQLVGFCDWDIAAPSSREFDLALSALWWVPLCPRSAVEPLGFHGFDGRSRRLHLLLDAYGYDAERQGFRAAVVERARRQAAAIRQMADSGDPAATRVLFVAEYLESAASDTEAFPNEFWAH
jgi:thiamine kinase-like enzyme